jgi:anti-sigma regulatory factor (Ser/Thr protein kinase)
MSSSENDLRVSLDQPFDVDGLVSLRSAVAAHADRLGLPAARIPELVLVAHELASNAVRHGGGTGRVRMWRDNGSVVCEISDAGPGLPTPSADQYSRPAVDALGGRGLWLAFHLSDEFTVKSDGAGTVAAAAFYASESRRA